MQFSDSGFVRLIGLFKLLKCALLIALGIGVFKLLHKDVSGVLEHWVKTLGLNPGNQFIERALQKASTLSPTKIKGLGAGSFVYAGLFLTEGIGLLLLKRWAEWFTIIVTSSLLPLECYEIHEHPTGIRVLVLLINIAVVGYLVLQIRHSRSA